MRKWIIAAAGVGLLAALSTAGRLPAVEDHSSLSHHYFNSAVAERPARDMRITPVVRAVKKVSDCVVNITTERKVNFSTSFPFGTGSPFFDEFFRDFFAPHFGEQKAPSTLGSGVILDRQGHVLTNEHVIDGASTITVKLADGRKFSAELIGASPEIDLALLKISGKGDFPFAGLGDSDDLMIGETVIAIGNPFGLSHSISTGVVSALHRSVRAGDKIYKDFIQTDAAINPGNSGGPLINILGQVIGINTAILSKGGVWHGIGFAIPINTAKRIVDDLLLFGEVQPIWLGMFVQDLNPRLAGYFGYRGDDQGVIIREIEKGGPAERAGLEVGDVVESIDNLPVESADDFRTLIAKYTPGDSMNLLIVRRGKKIEIKLKAAKFPKRYADDFMSKRLGFKVEERGGSVAHIFGGKRKRPYLVFKEVDPSGPAGRIGIRSGDVLLKFANQNVSTVKELRKAVLKSVYRRNAVILVQRGSWGYYVTLSYAP